MAAEVKLDFRIEGPSSFDIFDGGEKYGEMIFDIENKLLTIYHTEVKPEKEGKGFAKFMLDATVAYARKNNLKVMPMCPFAYMEFSNHVDLYGDVWEQDN